jgi:hypothetical protein
MSYMVDCATKEEWAARCFGAEYRLATAQARIKELEDFIDKAFETHSNLDLDVEALDTTNE